MISINSKLSALIVCAALVGGCATKPSTEQTASTTNTTNTTQSDPRDPLEPINRVMWDLNWEVLDRFLLKPAATVYVTVMPGFART